MEGLGRFGRYGGLAFGVSELAGYTLPRLSVIRQAPFAEAAPTGIRQPFRVAAKPWRVKLWSPVEGHPKKAEHVHWRRSSVRECRQAYATTLLSSVNDQMCRVSALRRAQADNSFVRAWRRGRSADRRPCNSVHHGWDHALARAIAYGDFRRLDRSAPRIPRGKLHAEWRDLVSTISGLSWRQGLSARACGPRSRRRGRELR